MKEHRVKPSKAAVTSIDVAGRHHHYFQSEKLGKCRAFFFEALPCPQSHVQMVNEEIDLYEQESAKKAEIPQKNMLSKGQRLEILMNCSDRLDERWQVAWTAYRALPENDIRSDAAFARLKGIQKASNRVTRKIAILMLES